MPLIAPTSHQKTDLDCKTGLNIKDFRSIRSVTIKTLAGTLTIASHFDGMGSRAEHRSVRVGGVWGGGEPSEPKDWIYRRARE